MLTFPGDVGNVFRGASDDVSGIIAVSSCFFIEGFFPRFRKNELSWLMAIHARSRRETYRITRKISDVALRDSYFSVLCGILKETTLALSEYARPVVRTDFRYHNSQMTAHLRDTFALQCKHALTKTDLLEQLRKEKYDVVLAENFDYCGFGETLIYRLAMVP